MDLWASAWTWAWILDLNPDPDPDLDMYQESRSDLNLDQDPDLDLDPGSCVWVACSVRVAPISDFVRYVWRMPRFSVADLRGLRVGCTDYI